MSSLKQRPKKSLQNTLSTKLIAKSRQKQQQYNNKTNISPFTIEHNDCMQYRQSKQIQGVKNINYQYAKLFQMLFKGRGDVDGGGMGSGKITREERYQYQCMKILRKSQEYVEKLDKLRKLEQDWSKIIQYLSQKSKISTKNPSQLIQALLNHYTQLSHNLQTLEKTHESLHNLQLQHILNKSDDTLTQLQKQYKRNQKLMNKKMYEEQYYEQKCREQERNLEILLDKIRKAQNSIMNIQMKSFAEENKKQRMERKIREKSLTSASNTNNQRIIRSKSTLRVQAKQ